MIIGVQWGAGEGPTHQAAFDAALCEAGIHDYNLIRLSSVIPAGATVQRWAFKAPQGEIGYRLYVVMAHAKAHTPGTEKWAGVGWVQDRNDGHGLFVEFTGDTREQLEQDISDSLKEMMERRSADYGPIDCAIARAVCRGRPAAAVVAAVYRSQNWE